MSGRNWENPLHLTSLRWLKKGQLLQSQKSLEKGYVSTSIGNDITDVFRNSYRSLDLKANLSFLATHASQKKFVLFVLEVSH